MHSVQSARMGLLKYFMIVYFFLNDMCAILNLTAFGCGEGGGLVVEPRTPEREVGGSIPTSALLCS